MDIFYPSQATVIDINRRIVALEGQTHSIQSSALDYLDIAASRFEDEPDFRKKIFKKAAYILERLCCGHPFIDGNKRTAFLATALFLTQNLRLADPLVVLDYEHAADFMCEIAQGKKSRGQIAEWLEEQVKIEEDSQKSYEEKE